MLFKNFKTWKLKGYEYEVDEKDLTFSNYIKHLWSNWKLYRKTRIKYVKQNR